MQLTGEIISRNGQQDVNLLTYSPEDNSFVTVCHVLLCIKHFYHFLGQRNSLANLDLSNTDCSLDQVSQEAHGYDTLPNKR